MHDRFPVAVAAALLLAACGSGGAALTPPMVPSQPVAAAQVISGAAGHLWEPTGAVSTFEVEAPLEAVRERMVSFATGLGLTAEGEGARVESAGVLRRRIGEAPLSSVLSCGRKALSQVEIAETYPVEVRLVAALSPAREGHTRVQVQLTGRARGTTTEAGRPAICDTTGRLERDLEAALARPG